MLTTTINQAVKHIPVLIKNGIVPFLHSSPALGKSSSVKTIAKQMQLKIIDLRLTELDSSDLNGLPYFKDGKSTFLPFDTFPLKDTPIPKGYKGWMIILDEFNSALPSVQASAYKLTLDRQVGQHKLHDNVAIVACGNLDTDNAIVNPMSSALISRFAHFYIEPNTDEWLDWARSNDINPMITSYIGFRPNCLYTFNPDSNEPYASPRTWQMLNQVIQDTDLKDLEVILLASLIGEGVAREFIEYIKLYETLDSFEDIIAKPNKIKIPSELGTKWAIMGMLSHKANTDNIEAICTYMLRYPAELQLCCFKEIIARQPAIINNPAFNEYKLKLAKQI